MLTFSQTRYITAAATAAAAAICLATTAPVEAKTVKGCVIKVSAKCSAKDLSGANLSRLNLTKANLSNADLSGANLTGATLTGANLTGANLTRATLLGARSGSITGAPTTLPTNWLLIKGYLVGFGANLTSANFGGATLSGANLAGSTLTGAKLASADLSGVRSGRINGTPASLPPKWILTKRWFGSSMNAGGFLLGPGANLAGADITVQKGWWTSESQECTTTVLKLDGVNLQGADLSGTNLHDCYGFAAVRLRGANLKGAKLVDTDLAGIDLSGANLLGADDTGAKYFQLDYSTCSSDHSIGYPFGCPMILAETILTGTTLPDGSIHP